MPAVRLVDVAARAGVSLATASRVINGSRRVPAADIAARVRAAADELGYVANAQAQALARSSTGLIGIVVHDIADPYFSSLVQGAQRRAREEHSQVLLAGTDRDPDAEVAAVAAFASYRADAIILAGSQRRRLDPRLTQVLQRYAGNGGRVVCFGRRPLVPGARMIEIRNRYGARRLVETLIDRGFRDFAILSGPPGLITSADRVAGYRAGLKAAGLAPLAIVAREFNRQGGHDAALEAWAAMGSPAGAGVCLLAATDVMAQGAITGLRSLGLRVPDDVAVTGFDDIPTLQDFDPPLTTYRLPLQQLGEQAVTLALDPEDGCWASVEGTVIVRESTQVPVELKPSGRDRPETPRAAAGGRSGTAPPRP